MQVTLSKLQLILLAALVGAVMGAVVRFAPGARPAGRDLTVGTVRTQRIELVNPAGKVLAVFGAFPGGSHMLSVFDERGKPAASIGVLGNGERVMLLSGYGSESPCYVRAAASDGAAVDVAEGNRIPRHLSH